MLRQDIGLFETLPLALFSLKAVASRTKEAFKLQNSERD